jgi:hypothetical protein
LATTTGCGLRARIAAALAAFICASELLSAPVFSTLLAPWLGALAPLSAIAVGDGFFFHHLHNTRKN